MARQSSGGARVSTKIQYHFSGDYEWKDATPTDSGNFHVDGAYESRIYLRVIEECGETGSVKMFGLMLKCNATAGHEGPWHTSNTSAGEVSWK